MGIGPTLNRALRLVGLELTRIERPESRLASISLLDLGPERVDGLDRETRKVLNLLAYTKTSGSAYDADQYESAYHSISIGGHDFIGQRKPAERLQGLPFDFSGASLLDIGCNQGGMLFEVADQIKSGVGIDYDHRMINAASRIRSFRNASHVDFFVFDIEREPLHLLANFLPQQRVDLIFLLSVCMWISNWRELIHCCAELSDKLLFETNGSVQQQNDQEDQLKRIYRKVLLIRDSSPDDPRQRRRKLFFCEA